MTVQRRTVEYFNREEEARKALKKYPKGYEVRRHPKWHTWDIVKKVKIKKRQSSYGFNFKIPKFRF